MVLEHYKVHLQTQKEDCYFSSLPVYNSFNLHSSLPSVHAFFFGFSEFLMCYFFVAMFLGLEYLTNIWYCFVVTGFMDRVSLRNYRKLSFLFTVNTFCFSGIQTVHFVHCVFDSDRFCFLLSSKGECENHWLLPCNCAHKLKNKLCFKYP